LLLLHLVNSPLAQARHSGHRRSRPIRYGIQALDTFATSSAMKP
jgi:hypothetical protein